VWGLLESLLTAGSITKAVIESKERRCGGIKEEKRCRLNTVSSELSFSNIPEGFSKRKEILPWQTTK
jgi:hypothetical protein